MTSEIPIGSIVNFGPEKNRMTGILVAINPKEGGGLTFKIDGTKPPYIDVQFSVDSKEVSKIVGGRRKRRTKRTHKKRRYTRRH